MASRSPLWTTAFCLSALCGGLTVLGAGCGESGSGPGSGKLSVVATTGMIADAARIVGGEHVEITALMGPGVDPHLFDLTRDAQKSLVEGDVVLYHGHHLEGKMAQFLTRLEKEKRAGQTVAAVGEAVPASELFKSEAAAAYPDPHIWFDLKLWKPVVAKIVETLSVADPDHAEDYRAAGAKLAAELEKTHQWALAEVAKVPNDQRRIVTSHDAYRYFAKAYGFEVRGLQGISTDTEPGLAEISDAVAYIKRHAIPVIFAETSVRRDAVERVSTDAGCKVCDTELYSDALGEEGSGADTFIGMFRHNVTTIVEALRSSTPAVEKRL